MLDSNGEDSKWRLWALMWPDLPDPKRPRWVFQHAGTFREPSTGRPIGSQRVNRAPLLKLPLGPQASVRPAPLSEARGVFSECRRCRLLHRFSLTEGPERRPVGTGLLLNPRRGVL